MINDNSKWFNTETGTTFINGYAINSATTPDDLRRYFPGDPVFSRLRRYYRCSTPMMIGAIPCKVSFFLTPYHHVRRIQFVPLLPTISENDKAEPKKYLRKCRDAYKALIQPVAGNPMAETSDGCVWGFLWGNVCACGSASIRGKCAAWISVNFAKEEWDII